MLVCVVTINIGQISSNQNFDSKQEIRTVTYNENALRKDNLYEDFDDYFVETNDNGFKISAEKRFDTNSFNAIDLVGIDTYEETVTVSYSITYYESENKVELNVMIVENGAELTEIIQGLVTANENGEVDVLFADEDGIIWLSDLVESGLIDNTGWWSSFKNWVKSVSTEIKNVIVKGLRLTLNIAVNIIGLENGSKVLSMYKDSYGIYHADFDAWQSIGGYNDLYDFVFQLGSSMQADKNVF